MPAFTDASPLPPLARSPEDWAAFAKERGGRAFHGKSIFRWIHARSVTEPEGMTDLPKALRDALTALELPKVLEIAEVRRSADRTRKLLVRMKDGATVETVLIPGVTRGKSSLPSPLEPAPEDFEDADAASAVDDDEDVDERGEPRELGPRGDALGAPPVRVTQCISTQVGCAMGCVFCASGVAGLKRHMAPDEIVAQVIAGRRLLDDGERLSNVVLMGMGEPLHNYASTKRALELLTHADGIGLSNRRVTVSTSGLVPEIKRLGEDFGGQIGLAISLHATTDETRSRLMPINKKYPLAVLLAALREYPLPKRRRITIEYTLVATKNDTLDEARRLAKLLRAIPVKINLIPMNPIEASALGPPDLSGVLAFQRVLTDAGYSCFIRRRRGDDVAAACGQLALAGEKRRVRVLRE
jgi:23S rRNA (adenine2503-C2)-methyltransferase